MIDGFRKIHSEIEKVFPALSDYLVGGIAFFVAMKCLLAILMVVFQHRLSPERREEWVCECF